MWTKRCDPVLHIELRRWADLFVIAPLDANTLGKIASGICDNLLVSNICVIVSLLQVELYDVCDFFYGFCIGCVITCAVLIWQTCVVRAWDTNRPLLFCPAMNTAMWNHPITAQQVATLKSFGYIEIPCISKKLVCGDEGIFKESDISGNLRW